MTNKVDKNLVSNLRSRDMGTRLRALKALIDKHHDHRTVIDFYVEVLLRKGDITADFEEQFFFIICSALKKNGNITLQNYGTVEDVLIECIRGKKKGLLSRKGKIKDTELPPHLMIIVIETISEVGSSKSENVLKEIIRTYQNQMLVEAARNALQNIDRRTHFGSSNGRNEQKDIQSFDIDQKNKGKERIIKKQFPNLNIQNGDVIDLTQAAGLEFGSSDAEEINPNDFDLGEYFVEEIPSDDDNTSVADNSINTNESTHNLNNNNSDGVVMDDDRNSNDELNQKKTDIFFEISSEEVNTQDTPEDEIALDSVFKPHKEIEAESRPNQHVEEDQSHLEKDEFEADDEEQYFDDSVEIKDFNENSDQLHDMEESEDENDIEIEVETDLEPDDLGEIEIDLDNDDDLDFELRSDEIDQDTNDEKLSGDDIGLNDEKFEKNNFDEDILDLDEHDDEGVQEPLLDNNKSAQTEKIDDTSINKNDEDKENKKQKKVLDDHTDVKSGDQMFEELMEEFSLDDSEKDKEKIKTKKESPIKKSKTPRKKSSQKRFQEVMRELEIEKASLTSKNGFKKKKNNNKELKIAVQKDDTNHQADLEKNDRDTILSAQEHGNIKEQSEKKEKIDGTPESEQHEEIFFDTSGEFTDEKIDELDQHQQSDSETVDFDFENDEEDEIQIEVDDDDDIPEQNNHEVDLDNDFINGQNEHMSDDIELLDDDDDKTEDENVDVAHDLDDVFLQEEQQPLHKQEKAPLGGKEIAVPEPDLVKTSFDIDLKMTPCLSTSVGNITELNISIDEGYLLSMIDGQTSIIDIARISGMDKEKTLQQLANMVRKGFITLK